MLVSEDRYRTITRDLATAAVAVTGQLVEAQRLIEDELRRPIEYGTSTERLPVYRDPESGRGCVYPRRSPVWSVPAGSSYEPRGTAELVGVEPDGWPTSELDATATVTLTGGWRAVDDPASSSSDRVPAKLERAIAQLAQALIQTLPAAELPAGVQSATVGDVSVTYVEPPDGGWIGLVPGLCDVLEGYEYRPYC